MTVDWRNGFALSRRSKHLASRHLSVSYITLQVALMEASLKKVLKAVTLELRHLLEGRYDSGGQWKPGDLEQRLAAIGVRRDRAPVPVDELPHLAEEDRRARR